MPEPTVVHSPRSDQTGFKSSYNDCISYLGRILDHDGGFEQTPEEAVAEVIPISHDLATKTDIAEIKVFVMKAGITIAGLAVLLNRFLDWVIR